VQEVPPTAVRPLLSPNPATDLVRMTFPDGLGNAELLEIVDITGKSVLSARPNTSTSVDLAIGHLAAGTYFARLHADGTILPAVMLEVVPR